MKALQLEDGAAGSDGAPTPLHLEALAERLYATRGLRLLLRSAAPSSAPVSGTAAYLHSLRRSFFVLESSVSGPVGALPLPLLPVAHCFPEGEAWQSLDLCACHLPLRSRSICILKFFSVRHAFQLRLAL